MKKCSLIQLDGVDNKESFLGSWLWLAQWSEVWASGRYDYLALYYEGSHIIIKHKPLFIALHSRIKSFPPKIPSSMYENQDLSLPSISTAVMDGLLLSLSNRNWGVAVRCSPWAVPSDNRSRLLMSHISPPLHEGSLQYACNKIGLKF